MHFFAREMARAAFFLLKLFLAHWYFRVSAAALFAKNGKCPADKMPRGIVQLAEAVSRWRLLRPGSLGFGRWCKSLAHLQLPRVNADLRLFSGFRAAFSILANIAYVL